MRELHLSSITSITMRSKFQDKYFQVTPGPGTYHKDGGISFKSLGKFGKESRGEVNSSKSNPGPGSYHLRPQSASTKYRFGTSNRDDFTQLKFSKNYPGPGTYQSPNLIGFSGIKSTMNPKRPNSASIFGGNHNPGPGTYKPEINRSSAPKYRIGNEIRCKDDTESKKVPGAGTYNPIDKTSTRPKTPSWKIGTSLRGDLYGGKMDPGPGSYNHKNLIGDGKKITMSIKYLPTSIDHFPGPGTYQPSKEFSSLLNNSPKYKSGKGPKIIGDLTSRRIVPGPGTYNQKSYFHGPKYRFTNQSKGLNFISGNPGPGTYKIPVKFYDTPKYLIPNKDPEFQFV